MYLFRLAIAITIVWSISTNAHGVTLQSGNLEIELKQSTGWSIRTMSLDDHPVSEAVSANGTVIRHNGNWLGSGHLGISLNNASLTVDGINKLLDESASYAGDNIVVTSDITYGDNLYSYQSTLTLEPNMITEQVYMQGTGQNTDQVTEIVYGHLQSFTADHTHYNAYDTDGNLVLSGVSIDGNGPWHSTHNAVVFHLHNPSRNQGVVVKVESDSADFRFEMDDRVLDNKLYFRTRDMEGHPLSSQVLNLTSITAFYTGGDTASYQTAMSLIPEPASAAIVFGMALPLLARRRR